MLLDSQKSILVCAKCGLCEYYPVYVTSYNHSSKPLRRKCIYKKSDNFKAILNQFFNDEKQLVPDDIMKQLGMKQIIKLIYCTTMKIPLTIPILECILTRNEMTKHKNGICYILLKINGQPFPYVMVKEYNMIPNTFNVVSSKYKPKDRKSFLNYYFLSLK